MSSRSDLKIKRVSLIIFLLSVLVEFCYGGFTSEYVRGSDLPDDMPLDSDVFEVPPGPNSPQQVHVTQGNHEGNGVIISWVTPVKPGSKTVQYWCENEKSRKQAEATVNTYRFFNYTSGYIHHCLIDDLEVSLITLKPFFSLDFWLILSLLSVLIVGFWFCVLVEYP
jgi:hypothetical protein